MWRVLLGISCLGLGIPSLGLKLYILSLGDHIPDCESILRVFGLHWWLSLLTLPSPFGDFSIKRRGLGGRELLRRRERCWNFSDVLWEENVSSPPQFRVNRDSRLIEHFCPYLGIIVPAHSCHLFCQPGLRVLHLTFIRCRLYGLRSFPSHPNCIIGFLQLSLEIQD